MAALRRGLADQHPHGGRPDLLRHVRQPRQARRSRASTRASARTSSTSPTARSTDYAQESDGTLAWTPELSAGCDGCGFVFPDDEALVQAEFERNLPFARSVADSAVDPDDPKTVTGIKTKPFYVDSDDPYKRGNPGVQLSFTKSYGDPQPVAVLAKRSLGAVTVKYRINGGAGAARHPRPSGRAGRAYSPASVYYHQMRGVVTGTDPGDSVEVWFEGGGQRSDSFTYQAVSESGNRVLVVAAEDYTGASPVQTPGPHFVDTYVDALAANGQQADVYDIDAAGGSPRTPSECSATTTPSSGRRATTWSPAPPGRAAATPTGWPSTRCWSSART